MKMIDPEARARISAEVVLRKPIAVPDTPDEAEFRKAITEQVKAIAAAGEIVDVPNVP